MANTVISPDMSLPVPVVTIDPGPDWATNLNACLSIIDGHTHTTGSGVQITPQAININSDLAFNDNNLTSVRTTRYQSHSSPINGASDLGCTYVQNVDLYYVDGAGNQVRITQGGSVTGSSGTITGLPSGTASASYAAGTFTFQSATNTPAAMNFGPLTLGQQIASGKNVTISAANAQAVNYNLTLPVAQAVSNSSAIVSDTSGNLSYVVLVPGTDTFPGLVANPTVYRVGVVYNGVLLAVTNVSGLGAFTVVTDSGFIPYQTYDNSWHLRFYLQLSATTNVSSGTFAIAGVVFRGTGMGGFNQAVAAAGVSGPAVASGYTTATTGNINLVSTAGETVWSVSGDVELASKPTWAN